MLQQDPDLSIGKWPEGGCARPGGVFVYGAWYGNYLTDTADVTIVDTLPVSTTYAGDTSGVTPIQGAGVITWHLGDLPSGAWGGFKVTLNIDGDSPIGSGVIAQNCVYITTTTSLYDSNPGNNHTCANTVDTCSSEVDVEIDKWSEVSDPLPGEEFVYGVRWCNNRGAHVGPVWLTDTLPAGMTFITATAPWDPNQSWTPNSLPGNVFEWNAGPMWSDSTRYFDIVVQITDTATAGDVLTNTIEIRDQSPNDVEPYYGNNAFELPVTIADKFSTVTTLNSSPNPSEPGELVTFVATVTSTGDTPIGSVMFYDNGVLLGTRTLNGSGIASYTTSALAAGTHPITATYGGDASFEASTSNMINQVVNTPPVATSDGYTMTVNTTLTVAAPGVLANDTDADSHPLTAVLDTDVLTGTLDLQTDGSFVYTPPQDYTGVVTFTYHTNDGYADSNAVQVTITVRDFTIYLPLVLRNY